MCPRERPRTLPYARLSDIWPNSRDDFYSALTLMGHPHLDIGHVRLASPRVSALHGTRLGGHPIGGHAVAKKQAAKKKAPVAVPRAGTAGEAAEYIGESLADLMNRKDALARQLATVNQRIASVSQIGSRLMEAVPRLVGLGRGKSVPKKTRATGTKTGNRKRKRPLPPDEPMVAQTERARAAEAKGRAANRARTSRRSGNR